MKPAIRFLLKSFAFSVIFAITVVLLYFPFFKMQETRDRSAKAQQAVSRQSAQEEARRKTAEQDADYKKDIALRDESWKRTWEQYKRNDEIFTQMETLVKRQAALVVQLAANAKREAAILAEQARRLSMSQDR